jgi:peptidoglycan hydrolase-like protein with peptidoglycan-binding domain
MFDPSDRTIIWRSLLAVCCVTLVAACGSSGSNSSSPSSAVTKAEAKVKSAESAVASATSAFDAASRKFCSNGKDLIATLDRYGKILDDKAVTVGDVKSGAKDLRAGQSSAESSAKVAVDAHDELTKAKQELVAAQAELRSAQEALAAGSTSSSTRASSTTTTTTTPLVPTATVDRVQRAEQQLASVGKNIDDSTSVREAGVKFHSAAFATEVAWLQLYVQAGCVTDDQRVRGVDTVTEYTRALQTDLAAAGYYQGVVDGVYGPSTVTAVEQLQKASGLPVTGLPDGPTQRALDARLQQKTNETVAGASTRNAAIQGALKVLGYWDGPVDGQWSDALGDAVKKLQTDLGIPATGVVDTVTLQALEEKLAGAKSLAESAATSSTTSTSTTSSNG